MRDGAAIGPVGAEAAGFSPYELHLLATMAAVARADMGPQTVEIVLATPAGSRGTASS